MAKTLVHLNETQCRVYLQIALAQRKRAAEGLKKNYAGSENVGALIDKEVAEIAHAINTLEPQKINEEPDPATKRRA